MNERSTDDAVDTEVIRWIRRRSHPLTTFDPEASLTDLEPLRDMVADAAVVGLGESARGARSAHEHYLLKHRLLRVLVEQLGFRSFAVEDDWTKGIQLDEYVRTGQGNPRSLLADAWGPWQTEEFLDVIRWIRSYNEQNPADPVRVVGLDYGAVRSLAYDAVIDYVRQTAPERLDELKSHYEVLRPTDEIDEHIEWYDRQQDKQPFIDHARAAYDLVESLPTRDGHALALRHARIILGFYEYHASAELGEGNLRMADTVIWWHEHTGDKIVYWGGMAHTADGEALTGSFPPARSSPLTGRSDGSYLREHFGSEYVSIGLTFHHSSGAEPVPAPSTGFAESTLGSAAAANFYLDLSSPQPDAVHAWLTAPAKTRVIGPYYDPENDPDYYMTGGSLAEWFNVLVHVQEVSPAHYLE